MQHDTHLTQHIRVPVEILYLEGLIQRLTADISELQQALNLKDAQIDEFANSNAAMKELIQVLRDEIAILKGQKPKPNIPASLLEGAKRRRKRHARFQLGFEIEKPILFSVWIKNSQGCDVLLRRYCVKIIADVTRSFQLRAFEISRLAKNVIKDIRRVGKPGQPRGKPRKKKKTLLKIHEKLVIHPESIPEGAVFKGYRPYTVQDIVFESHNTQYQMALWQLPDGQVLIKCR